MVGVVLLLHEVLDTVRNPGQIGGVMSKGLLWKEVVVGGGDCVQELNPLSLDVSE